MAKYSFLEKRFYGSHKDIKGAVENFYSENGLRFDKVVETCRQHWESEVPLFEKLDLKRYYAQPGETMSLENPFYPEENQEIVGPGFIVQEDYLMRYKFALDNLFLAVRHTNYFHCLSAITFGISAIDAFLNFGARRWSSLRPDAILEDTRIAPVSLERKIDEWIPNLGNGKKFDKSVDLWQDFKKLKTQRDDLAVHPKSSGLTISLKDFCEEINIFRTGISGLLFELHKLCNVCAVPVPSIIIRHYYCPDAYICSSDTNP